MRQDKWMTIQVNDGGQRDYLKTKVLTRVEKSYT